MTSGYIFAINARRFIFINLYSSLVLETLTDTKALAVCEVLREQVTHPDIACSVDADQMEDLIWGVLKQNASDSHLRDSYYNIGTPDVLHALGFVMRHHNDRFMVLDDDVSEGVFLPVTYVEENDVGQVDESEEPK